ncbi:unnamed protein product, partial [Symbiodinium sp. KB8]
MPRCAERGQPLSARGGAPIPRAVGAWRDPSRRSSLADLFFRSHGNACALIAHLAGPAAGPHGRRPPRCGGGSEGE